MGKPLKTKSFYGTASSLRGAHDYMRFIKENPYIEIISLIVVDDDYIVLTYK